MLIAQSHLELSARVVKNVNIMMWQFAHNKAF